MYRKILSSVASAALMCAPVLAKKSVNRTAQLISLDDWDNNSRQQAVATADLAGQGASGQPVANTSSLAQFRVHDLSRRWVDFQMAQGLAAPPAATEPAVAAERQPVWPTHSIAIPDWMRSVAAGRDVPSYIMSGCHPLPYHPTGFLKRDAESRRRSYYELMSQIACEHGIPTGLFDAMIIQESRYNPLAVSSKRAFGLTQLMPGTAALLGVNRFDVIDNLRGGARYLRSHLDRFGRTDLALAAYNAGPGRVRNGRVPALQETQGYVSSILNSWNRLTLPFSASTIRPVSQPRAQRVAVSSAF